MADDTGIEWTDATWNPLRGCSRVSAGCANCYAEHVAARFSGPGQPYEGLARWTEKREAVWTGRVVLVPKMLDQPARWQRPRRIFVNSMSDLFHETVPAEWITQICDGMAAAPQHRFQVLTKRAGRMADYLLAQSPARLRTLAHVWWGTSIENQAVAEGRMSELYRSRANNLWVSAEPLLGPLDLRKWLVTSRFVENYEKLAEGAGGEARLPEHLRWNGTLPPSIAWVVAGGESGAGARGMELRWARDVRDQCVAAGVPFLFKQWGEWAPESTSPSPLVRLGKGKAGRELDGRLWDEYPKGMVV